MQQLKTLATKKTARSKLLNVKTTSWERDRIIALANEFANGNTSEWIRYAALNFRPRKRDLAHNEDGVKDDGNIEKAVKSNVAYERLDD